MYICMFNAHFDPVLWSSSSKACELLVQSRGVHTQPCFTCFLLYSKPSHVHVTDLPYPYAAYASVTWCSHPCMLSYPTASPATSMSLTYPIHMLLMHQSRGVHSHACFLIAQPRVHVTDLSIMLLLQVDEEFSGAVINKLSERKGIMLDMRPAAEVLAVFICTCKCMGTCVCLC
jgi:hypothetical protein